MYLQTYICTCKGLIEGRTPGWIDRQDKDKVVHHMSRWHTVELEVQLHQLLSSALERSDWSAPRSGRFSLRKAPGIL